MLLNFYHCEMFNTMIQRVFSRKSVEYLRLKITCLRVSHKKKIWRKKTFFLHPNCHWRKESDPELDPDPNPLVRGTDPRIPIRTKMSYGSPALSSGVPEARLDCSSVDELGRRQVPTLQVEHERFELQQDTARPFRSVQSNLRQIK